MPRPTLSPEVGKDKAYRSDSNPIEAKFSKVKAVLRRLKVWTFEALIAALGVALAEVVARDIRGWSGHAGDQTAPSSATAESE